VSQSIDALLDHIDVPAPFTLLDFGCGPVRDLRRSKARGHRVIGPEESLQRAAMASTNSGYEVLEQRIRELNLPVSHFDGVFANAVLFVIPRQALPLVLRQLHSAVKPGGVFFGSNPHGKGQAGWNGDRCGVFQDGPAWHGHVSAVRIRGTFPLPPPDGCADRTATLARQGVAKIPALKRLVRCRSNIRPFRHRRPHPMENS
jgi:SAM-dependent methyltransferase